MYNVYKNSFVMIVYDKKKNWLKKDNNKPVG